MIVLDSDHLSVLKYQESPLCRRLLRRMETSPDPDFDFDVSPSGSTT